jgi:4-amino-4-deoxy-L-arabinose transferase-like glycosyltransferase
MQERSPWRDPSSTRIAIALSIFAAVANGVWIFLDHSVPSWDQSHYLTVTLAYQHAFEANGPIELLRAIKNVDPSHGPLYTVALLPFVKIFGASAQSGLLLNLMAAPFLYFCAGEIAWTIFHNWVARLLTIVLAATMPLMTGLFHNVLVDFLLVVLATASVLLLLKSEGFQRRGYTIGMAAVMAAGTLTKVTFPAFVIGPLVVVLAQIVVATVFSRENVAALRVDRRRLLVNCGIALVIFLVLTLAWYVPNFHETIEYIRSTTSGPLSEGAGPADPYTFHAITAFTSGVFNFNLSWVIVLLGAVAVVLNWPRLVSLFRRPIHTRPLWALAFLLTWVVIPYLSVALAHNQDVRLMAAAFPGVAVLVAGALSYVPSSSVRYALAGIAVFVLTYQSVDHVVEITPGHLTEAKVELGDYAEVVQLDSTPVGYEQLPGHDFTTPVLEYIEQVAASDPGGATETRSVCMLQSEATMNSNTIGFLSEARGDPFLVEDVTIGPEGTKGLREALSGCDFAIYVPPPATRPGGSESRLAIVNEPFAADHMTPALLALFDGPRRSFPLHNSGTNPSEPGFLNPEGGNKVEVLVRTTEAKVKASGN